MAVAVSGVLTPKHPDTTSHLSGCEPATVTGTGPALLLWRPGLGGSRTRGIVLPLYRRLMKCRMHLFESRDRTETGPLPCAGPPPCECAVVAPPHHFPDCTPRVWADLWDMVCPKGHSSRWRCLVHDCTAVLLRPLPLTGQPNGTRTHSPFALRPPPPSVCGGGRKTLCARCMQQLTTSHAHNNRQANDCSAGSATAPAGTTSNTQTGLSRQTFSLRVMYLRGALTYTSCGSAAACNILCVCMVGWMHPAQQHRNCRAVLDVFRSGKESAVLEQMFRSGRDAA